MKISTAIIYGVFIILIFAFYKKHENDKHFTKQAQILTEALTITARSEERINEYYKNNNKMPSNNSITMIQPSESFTSDNVQNLTVMTDGTILVNLKNFPLVTNAWIKSTRSTDSTWTCETNIPFIQKFKTASYLQKENCQYVK